MQNGFDVNEIMFKCRKGFQSATEKLGEVFESSQGQIRKAQIKNELKEAYMALGQECYDMAESGQDRTIPMQEAMKRINKLRTELKTLDGQNCQGESVKTCGACGNVCTPEFSYCFKCGHKLQ